MIGNRSTVEAPSIPDKIELIGFYVVKDKIDKKLLESDETLVTISKLVCTTDSDIYHYITRYTNSAINDIGKSITCKCGYKFPSDGYVYVIQHTSHDNTWCMQKLDN